MTPSPAPQRRRGKADRPKARVMYADFNWCDLAGNDAAKVFAKPLSYRQSVLVIPCASTKSARKRLSFERLTFEQKELALGKLILDTSEINFGHKGPRAITWDSLDPKEVLYYLSLSRAILHLLGEGEEKP